MNRSSTYLLGTILSVGVTAALAAGTLARDHRAIPPLADGAACIGPDLFAEDITFERFTVTDDADGQPLVGFKMGFWVASFGIADYRTEEVEILARARLFVGAEADPVWSALATVRDIPVDEGFMFQDFTFGDALDVKLTIPELWQARLELEIDHLNLDYAIDDNPANDDCDLSNNFFVLEGAQLAQVLADHDFDLGLELDKALAGGPALPPKYAEVTSGFVSLPWSLNVNDPDAPLTTISLATTVPASKPLLPILLPISLSTSRCFR